MDNLEKGIEQVRPWPGDDDEISDEVIVFSRFEPDDPENPQNFSFRRRISTQQSCVLMCDLDGGEEKYVDETFRWYDNPIVSLGTDEGKRRPGGAPPRDGGWHIDGGSFTHFWMPQKSLWQLFLSTALR
jgi:hypothetical protein